MRHNTFASSSIDDFLQIVKMMPAAYKLHLRQVCIERPMIRRAQREDDSPRDDLRKPRSRLLRFCDAHTDVETRNTVAGWRQTELEFIPEGPVTTNMRKQSMDLCGALPIQTHVTAAMQKVRERTRARTVNVQLPEISNFIPTMVSLMMLHSDDLVA
ncbi:hypothetical protein EK21DRAFT_112458 [Setomelanomma holmii]|uniref:Uncharacterized protein n=1 Tax=Setomelanomma holmii TaxID=210430 RepID=A0A9P4HA45_9PLEO|nr:hypothetical protein EK21DRAFT_112458 [Setomelanomma holmii]